MSFTIVLTTFTISVVGLDTLQYSETITEEKPEKFSTLMNNNKRHKMLQKID